MSSKRADATELADEADSFEAARSDAAVTRNHDTVPTAARGLIIGRLMPAPLDGRFRAPLASGRRGAPIAYREVRDPLP
ncbi:hypothetical protein DJ82_04085 [Halorubrum sp. Ib24]|nr:hypothetical protein DJ82_04085 [Halorubrum sp. Ib24]OYR45572.1 hypothetical protein DJ81_04540 [Halorubrum sp. Hd13]OYR47923.1 hypothetical protein DJ74_11895 [Halorubrum sp. Ea8]OYR53124.1 hypothetical protein DJ73_09150 [Halorubrum sp. Ea1]